METMGIKSILAKKKIEKSQPLTSTHIFYPMLDFVIGGICVYTLFPSKVTYPIRYEGSPKHALDGGNLKFSTVEI